MITLKRKTFLFLLGLCIGLVSSFGQVSPTQKNEPLRGKPLSKAIQKLFDSRRNGGKPTSRQDNARLRTEWEYNRVKDPKTGRIPTNILELEQQFSQGIEVDESFRKATKAQGKSTKAQGPDMEYWKNRGPFNVGGRTRALAIDRSNENVILAGGVSGGLWRSENGGNSWQKVTTNQQSHSITYIIQDPRQGEENVWYYTSGELFLNTAGYIENDERFIGATYFGSGIYKSVDGARTFTLLESTNDDDITQDSPFDLVNSIAIDPKTGAIYAATHMGIYKSADAGATFTAVLSNNSRLQNTEIHSTQDGVLYASIASGNDTAGIYTSIDGDKWTRLPIFDELSNNFIRALITSNTENNTIHIFAAYDSNNRLIKYTPASGIEEEKIIDLSTIIPYVNTQGGYNMVLKAHPTDPNLMFLGGVILYRSASGFEEIDETIIGGNHSNPNSFDNGVLGRFVSVTYPNHHQDQHLLVFYPSDPLRALSGNDGGVYRTEDITKSVTNRDGTTVNWTPLNNGFLTTQAYHVAMDMETSSTDLVAGFQDNGTWFTDSDQSDTPWVQDLGGDGGYNAITEFGRVRYVSLQNGAITKLKFDDYGNYVNFTSISGSIIPIGIQEFQFITPFVIDPNEINTMYLPNSNGELYRIDRLDEVPAGDLEALNIGPILESRKTIFSTFDRNNKITALDVSRYPIKHRVYAGTQTGKVFRVENADGANPEIVDISENKGLPEGYINDITIDPSNSDRVLVVFSNYGIPSVFLTNDAGETWIDISGNLEENADGSGNGPSVRCAGFLGSGAGKRAQRRQTLFVGTSTGLYTNSNVREGTTRWKREEFAIGNVVIDELTIRKDGFVAIATHGRGIFSARFPVTDSLPDFLRQQKSLKDITEVLTEDNRDVLTTIAVKDVFVKPFEDVLLSVEGSNDTIAKAQIKDGNIIIINKGGVRGVVRFTLIGKVGEEQLSTSFDIVYEKEGLFHQNNAEFDTTELELPSYYFDDNDLIIAADDFVIPSGQTWSIDRFLGIGDSFGETEPWNGVAVIYANDNGKPGKEVYRSEPITTRKNSNEETYELLDIELSKPLALSAGRYWVSLYAISELDRGNFWFWDTQELRNGNEAVFIESGGSFSRFSTSEANPEFRYDLKFQLFGSLIGTNSNGNKITATDEQLLATIYPNPSLDYFVLDFSTLSLKEEITLEVTNIAGKKVLQKSGISTSLPYRVDASGFAPGLYIVTINGATQSKTFKVIKR